MPDARAAAPSHDEARDHVYRDGWLRCRRSPVLTNFGWSDAKVCGVCGQHLTPSGGGAAAHVRAHGR